MANEPIQAVEPDEDQTTEETPVEPTDAPSQESETPEPTESTETPEEESADEPSTDETAAETPQEEQPRTRKERREERKRYYDSIRRENATQFSRLPVEEYQPRAYNELVTDEGLLDTRAAEEDRKAYAQAEGQKVARREQFKAEQEKFRQSVDLEKRMIEVDPKYSFMKEDSPDFDPDLTEAINDRFLAVTGYREVPTTDPNTGQVTTSWVVDRPDVSYEKFVKQEVALWDRIAEERSDRTAKNTASQKANRGTRPSGTRRMPDLSDPNVIAKMSPDEFKKYEKQILDHASTLPPK